MSEILFVVNSADRWDMDIPGVTIVSARQYLTQPEYPLMRNARVYNLCRSYAYQSVGYYVSLLAEARGHKPLPRIATIQDLKTLSLLKVVSSELDQLISKSLQHLQHDTFTLSIYFGQNVAKHYERLSRELFNLFPAPLLRATFARSHDRWNLQNISPIPSSEIPEDHRPLIPAMAEVFFSSRRYSIPRKNRPRFFMAILAGDTDSTPPSDEKAIQKFIKAAKSFHISTEVITKDDYGRLGEFDALFIRETTSVNHHTYRFARRAEAEGLVVMDDPQSIVKCANKVFLAELFERYHIPAPATLIVHKDNYREIPGKIGLPCVLKLPDSAFSKGVIKVKDEVELFRTVLEMLEESDLVIAQAFLPTSFDWRIGIIDQKAFYACKYYMARGHWQIYNHASKGSGITGRADAVPIELVPRRVVQTALKAANLIGSGLYGVDVKEVDGKPYLVEVNDNPSIDNGIEDDIIKDALYERIMEIFLKRLEEKRSPRP